MEAFSQRFFARTQNKALLVKKACEIKEDVLEGLKEEAKEQGNEETHSVITLTPAGSVSMGQCRR